MRDAQRVQVRERPHELEAIAADIAYRQRAAGNPGVQRGGQVLHDEVRHEPLGAVCAAWRICLKRIEEPHNAWMLQAFQHRTLDQSLHVTFSHNGALDCNKCTTLCLRKAHSAKVAMAK